MGDCADAKETMCSMPKFTEYTGLAKDVKYACGKCAGETKGTTCEECTGAADKGCNTAKEVGADFNCYTYTYNTTSKAFDMSAKASACKRLKATSIVCNMPKKDATQTNYTMTTDAESAPQKLPPVKNVPKTAA